MALNRGQVKDYLKRLGNKKTLRMTELEKWIDHLDGEELAVLSREHFVNMYEPMLKNRLIVDGAYKGRVLGQSSYLHIRPNFEQDIQVHESVVSTRDRVSWGKFKNKYVKGLGKEKKIEFRKMDIDEQVNVINEWLDTNPLQEWEYWSLDYRFPINGLTAVQMYKIKRFSRDEEGDTAQYHPLAVLGDMQGDWDGDTITKKWLSKEETESLLKFTRRQDQNGKWGGLSDVYRTMHSPLKLEIFEGPEKRGLSEPDAVMQGVLDSYQASGAVGLVQNVISMRGVLLAKNFEMTIEDKEGPYTLSVIRANQDVVMPWALKDNIVEENLNPGETIVERDGVKYLRTKSRNALSYILQAALDDVKLGLLSHWGYDGVPFVLQQILEKKRGEEIEFIEEEDAFNIWNILGSNERYPGFRFSGFRNGRASNGDRASMRQVMYASKRISDQKNMTSEELASLIKANNARKGLGPGTDFNILDVSISRRPTHTENLLSRPYEFFEDKYGSEEYLSFMRHDINIEKNAHRMTMEELSNKIPEYRKPASEGGIFQDGISEQDETDGFVFFKKLAKPFYTILDQGTSVKKGIQRDTSFSLAAYDYDDAFKKLIADHRKEFDALSPQAQFVSTIYFLQGASGDYTKVAPETKQKLAELSNEEGDVLNLLKIYESQIRELNTERKHLVKDIKEGKVTPTTAKPTKSGLMDFEYGDEALAGVESANTFDAVLNGERTATTRFKKLNYWKDLKIGDTVQFRKGKENLLVRITSAPREVDFANMSLTEMKQWSEKEGWNVEKAEKYAKGKKVGLQFEFELIDLTPEPGEVMFPGIKIVSGAQTGSDRGALQAAKYDLKVNHGGFMTSDRKAEDNMGDEVLEEFGMDTVASTQYPSRSQKNVDISDGTLAIRMKPSRGTDKTIVYARTREWDFGVVKSQDDGHRPVLVLRDFDNTENNRKKIRDFIDKNNISVLNVAGHTESSVPGMQEGTRQLLGAALRGEPTVTIPLTDKIDLIDRQIMSQKEYRKAAEKRLQVIVDTFEEFNSIKDKNTKQVGKRYISNLLPFDLTSKEAMNEYGKEWGAQEKLATDEDPVSPFLIDYVKFDKILSDDMRKKDNCA